MPTPRPIPGPIIRGMRTEITGTPTGSTCTLTAFTRDPTGITVTPAASTVTGTGIARIATRTTDLATGTTPRAINGRASGRAFAPTGTVTGPAPGTFICSTAPAPPTVTDSDPRPPAIAARSTPAFPSPSGRPLRGSGERSRANSVQVHRFVSLRDISLS